MRRKIPGQKTFGSELRRMRESIGMSQSTLGQSIGVSFVFISDMERSARVTDSMPPSIPKIRKLLGCVGHDSPETLEQMILLAAEERGGFRIPFHGQTPVVKSVLCKIAQMVCNGVLTDDIARKIEMVAVN